LVDTGAWYTVVDLEIAKRIGVDYTGSILSLTSFLGHKVLCCEALIRSITIEEKTVSPELIAVCSVSGSVRDLLKKYNVVEEVIIDTHTLEKLGYAVDVATHRLIESSGILMI